MVLSVAEPENLTFIRFNENKDEDAKLIIYITSNGNVVNENVSLEIFFICKVIFCFIENEKVTNIKLINIYAVNVR